MKYRNTYTMLQIYEVMLTPLLTIPSIPFHLPFSSAPHLPSGLATKRYLPSICLQYVQAINVAIEMQQSMRVVIIGVYIQ